MLPFDFEQEVDCKFEIRDLICIYALTWDIGSEMPNSVTNAIADFIDPDNSIITKFFEDYVVDKEDLRENYHAYEPYLKAAFYGEEVEDEDDDIIEYEDDDEDDEYDVEYDFDEDDRNVLHSLADQVSKIQKAINKLLNQ
jgi:hypothetical protein